MPRAKPTRSLDAMSVLVWWLGPLVAVGVAILVTALLRRRELRRANEDWRAAQLAKKGAVLYSEQLEQPQWQNPLSQLPPRERETPRQRATSHDKAASAAAEHQKTAETTELKSEPADD